MSKLKQGMALFYGTLDFLSKNHEELGDAFTLTLPGSRPIVFINTPEAAREILALKDDKIDQAKIPFPLDIGEKHTGFLKGKEHTDARKILIPNVNTQRLKNRAIDMLEIIDARVSRINQGEKIEMCSFIGDVTLDIACFTLTGYKSGAKKERYKRLMSRWLTYSTSNTMFSLGTMVGPARWRAMLHGSYQRKIANGKHIDEKRFYITPWGRSVDLKVQLDHMLRADIAEARANPDADRIDTLFVLSNATDSDGKLLSEDRIIAESLAVLFGGHETSAGTGGFLAMWLLKSPHAIEKIIEEVETSIKEHGRFDPLAICELPYLNAALMESQRLTPTTMATLRCLVEDTEIAGYKIPAGVNLATSSYVIGHRKDVWGEDADEFRPERWLEGRATKPYEFFPFGGGRRACVGMNQARQQLKILFAQMLLRTEWDSIYKNNDTWPGQASVGGTTQPTGGVPITLRLRKNSAYP